MSRETAEWLNRNVLVGFTAKRGNAWHYRADLQAAEPNHYEGAIPVDDVLRRLFAWKAIELPVSVQIPASYETMTGVSEEGEPIRAVVLTDRKAIATSDTYEVMGLFKSGYQPHQYDEWLLHNVATILDDDLAISSAGLLKNRAVAWCEVSVPENILTPEGVEFRPNLLACTSFDGSLATTYKRTVQLTVCDNTMAVALGEKGQQIKIRHSKKSLNRIADAREALAIVYDTADAFTQEIAILTSQKVTETEWRKVLDALVPVPDRKESQRGYTLAVDKQLQLDSMYRYDSRVSPWRGTAFGVLQAFNTWTHHEQPTRGATIRAERNMLNAINGEGERTDAKVLEVLAGI